MVQRLGGKSSEFQMPIYAAMLQVAGAALGLWLVIPWLQARAEEGGRQPDLHEWLLGLAFVLGGISLLGPPLLLVTAMHRRWGAGRLLWFAYGTAVWVLWPPVVYKRIDSGGKFYTNCGSFFYSAAPVMAMCLTCALLAAGTLRRSQRRRLCRSWQETNGLILGLAWMCVGLLLVGIYYRMDLLGR